MTTSRTHAPRHSAHEDDETAILPRIPDDKDQTAVLPAQSGADKTAILPVFLLAPALPGKSTPAEQQPTPAAAGTGSGSAPASPGPGLAAPGSASTEPAAPGSAPAEPTEPGSGPAVSGTAPARSVGDAVRLVARSAGEVLITFGMVVLLLAAYEIWGKGAIIHAHQSDLNNQLSQAWGNPAVGASATPSVGAPPPGWAIARLYIPKLNLQWVVVEGVDLKDIRYAPGHYPGTAMPGQLGNFSVAGHREPGIFWDLDRVQPGDDLVVETRTNWYVYQVFQNHIVTPHSIEVVAPVPNEPGVPPTQKDMTLTTCNPKWDNYQRLAVHATLIAAYPHSVRPAQLGG
jgi:sortase A